MDNKIRDPACITSDHGTQFYGTDWAALCQCQRVLRRQIIAYLPQSNEIVEQVHSQFTDDLRARDCGNKWSAHLSGLIAVPKEESGVLTAELVRYMAAS